MGVDADGVRCEVWEVGRNLLKYVLFCPTAFQAKFLDVVVPIK